MLLCSNGYVLKLCDFGWASHIEDYEWLQISGGTYAYMAPETLAKKTQNASSDVWSLGVLLFEIYEGVEPYKE